MKNLKIRVNSANESKEIQNILESKGFKKWEGWSELGSIGGFIWTDIDMTYCDNKIEYFDESPRKEITIPELRAMANQEQDEPFLTPECTLNEHCSGTVKSYIDNFHVSSIERKIPEIYGTVRVNPDLSDQYAEIEKVRQHNHYFKDVSNLNEIDVYMVLKLFNVTDPCLQHIAKKALCAGQRGHKNFNRDLKDILDTAKRAVEINNG